MRGFILFLGLSFFLLSGGCSQGEKMNEQKSTDSLYVKTDKFLKDYVGENFLNSYLIKIPSGIVKDSSGYKIPYLEKIDILNYSDTIFFLLNRSGKIINANKIKGLPDCVASAEFCEFKIDSMQVRKILNDNKIPNGIKPWEITSYWDNTQKRFFWKVKVTEKEIKTPLLERGEGLRIIIDPANGEIVNKEKWRIL